MPYKFDSIAINDETKDKRVKLTAKQKESIKKEYETGLVSQRFLADKYDVSRRTIQFILDPEKAKRNKELFAQRQKDGRYYDKEKHTKSVKAHRDHKKELYAKGELKEKK